LGWMDESSHWNKITRRSQKNVFNMYTSLRTAESETGTKHMFRDNPRDTLLALLTRTKNDCQRPRALSVWVSLVRASKLYCHVSFSSFC
jgi:hypothetical protein